MLSVASIFGLICFILSILFLNKSIEVKEICNANHTMCPNCDMCEIWNLSSACFNRKVSYLIDNDFTVCFAIFMSFWSILFLELWKRHQCRLQYKWNLMDLNKIDEPTRLEYHIKAGLTLDPNNDKKNTGTTLDHPNISYLTKKLPARFCSASTVIFLTLITVVITVSIIAYRIAVGVTLIKNDNNVARAKLVSSVTSGFINLLIIMIFKKIYDQIAEKLTEMELHRTQTEFDNALVWKLYILQFLNNYSTLFYIAFVKGTFVGSPSKYNRIFEYRFEEVWMGYKK